MRTAPAITALTISALLAGAHAGPITPAAGPVAPTMKTLTEVEPRTAINATNTPGDATNVFRITQPGSYYLTGDVTVGSGKSGIRVDVSNVTIDFNGYTVKGSAGSLSGVVGAGLQRITVRNGRIATMGGAGISISAPNIQEQSVAVENMVVSESGNYGINIGSGSVSGCVVERSGSIGVFINTSTADSSIIDSRFYDNGSDGLNMYSGVVRNCTASSNNGTGLAVSTAAVIGCTSRGNVDGIRIEAGTATGCAVQDNTAIGIRASGNSLVKGNSISANNLSAAPTVGIYVQNSSGARIEGNAITRMVTGIGTGTSNNLIIGNSFRGCTNAVSLVANNRLGPLVSASSSPAITGNSGGGLGATDPYANIIY